jgi:hypothetical protein
VSEINAVDCIIELNIKLLEENKCLINMLKRIDPMTFDAEYDCAECNQGVSTTEPYCIFCGEREHTKDCEWNTLLKESQNE